MASDMESSVKNKIVQWIKDGVDLVSLTEGGEIGDAEDVRQYLASSSDPSCVNRCNHLGQTPLMIACKNRQKDIVNLLLEAGADPNLTCTVSGSTALHYACQGDKPMISICRTKIKYPKQELQRIIDIIEILIHNGAILQMNDDGLSPVCVAALNSFKDVVEYFSSKSEIPVPPGDMVKAYELLGVSQALFDVYHLVDACHSFHLAASSWKHPGNESDLSSLHVDCALDNFFTHMTTLVLNGVLRSKIRRKAFTIGIKSIPDNAKVKYDFWRFTSSYTDPAFFEIGSEEGYNLLLSLVRKEMLGKCPLGTVLDMIQNALTSRLSTSLGVKFIPRLLQVYAEGFQGDSGMLREKRPEILELLGGLLFNFAYYQSQAKYLEEVLSYVKDILHCMKMYAEDGCPTIGDRPISVISVFFENMANTMFDDMYCGQTKEVRNRLKYVIFGLLFHNGYDPASDSSLLETLVKIVAVAHDRDFIIPIAKMLIRYGCPPDSVCIEQSEQDYPEVIEMLPLLNPTSPPSLEELSTQVILRNNVPYRERLPSLLSERIDADMYFRPPPSDLDSSVSSDSSEESDEGSPLMIACMHTNNELVSFLLKHGADPNATSTKGGNTPMHFASIGCNCCCLWGESCHLFDSYLNKVAKKPRTDMMRNLISHGATLQCNSDGLDPPSFAARHKFKASVDFFVNRGTCRLKVPSEQKARACEIYAVVVALTMGYCKADDVTPHEYLCKAFAIRKGSGVPVPDQERVGIANHFSLFRMKACTTEKDWQQIQSDNWAVRIQCFLVACRVLPVEKRDIYLFPRLLTHGHDCYLFSKGNERRSEGTQIFEEAVQWELKSTTAKLGSVLKMILNVLYVIFFVRRDIQLRHDLFGECYKLLELCLQEFTELSDSHLHKFATELAHDHLGAFLYHVPLYDFSMSKEMFKSLLQVFGRMICMMRRRCGRSSPSVTHYIMDRMTQILLDSDSKGTLKENRVKLLISALVQCEDATQISDSGNSMLHPLFNIITYDLYPLLLRDVSLILIRNGCDPDVCNADGKTVKEMLGNYVFFDPNSPKDKQVVTVISPPTEVLRLEEIAARTILRHKIPHEGILPRHLSVMVRGETEPDAELFLSSPPRFNFKYGDWDYDDESLDKSDDESLDESDDDDDDDDSWDGENDD
ncbi:uncharacterized protein LOC121427316 [Lytechinus variegatus]|uniref:uncharacterized protein LOC121427316 n=1 Tax=Lytechinus variegatus TaxID=7654 RepID=UPI001BB2C2A8|nr:uncharacterized protein LOC121427316 [Lytechinus variegatus]